MLNEVLNLEGSIIMREKSLDNLHESVPVQNKGGWRKFMAFIGPAYLVSVGYMDPGNWATDLQGVLNLATN